MNIDDIFARDFASDLAAEQKDTLRPEVKDILRNLFPDATGMNRVTDLHEQLSGIDVKINFPDRDSYALDFKFRDRSWGDFALEYEHRHDDGRKTLGWVTDEKKQSDYIAYIFKDTWTCYLISAPMLHAAWRKYGSLWISNYQQSHHRTRNTSYWTIWCPVPISLLHEVVWIRSANRRCCL